MLKLYSFYWDCGRMGDLQGLFVANPEDVTKVIGKEIYFGEVLGKHSDVNGTLEEKDLEVISEEQDKIEWLFSLFNGCTTISGYNPLDYYEPEEEYIEEDED